MGNKLVKPKSKAPQTKRPLTETEVAQIEAAQAQSLKAKVVRDMMGLYQLVDEAAQLARSASPAKDELIAARDFLCERIVDLTAELIRPVVASLKAAAEPSPEPSLIVMP